MVVVVTTPANAVAGDVVGTEDTTLGAGDWIHRWSWDAREQRVWNNASNGTFTLTFEGETTGDLAYNISAGDLENAIQGLDSIAAGVDVSVSGMGTVGSPWIVTFPNPQRPIYAMTADDSSLIPGSSTTTIVARRDLPADPSGVAHIGSGDLGVSDSDRYAGHNLWEFDPIDAQNHTGTASISVSDEPNGLAYNSNNNHLFVTDADDERIYDVANAGAGSATSISAASIGVNSVRDVAYDADSNTLFVAGGTKIVPVNLGGNGVLNPGDSVGQTISLSGTVLSIQGLGYRAATDTLLLTDVVGGTRLWLTEITRDGRLIRFYRMPFTVNPSDVAVAPAAMGGGDSVYVVDPRTDSANTQGGLVPIDGRLYELDIPFANLRPFVDAGPNAAALTGVAIPLSGDTYDDGQPVNPGSLTTTWSKVSGPGTVSFGNASALSTTATFSQTGNYTLQLRSYDGQYANTDTIAITVAASNEAPTVSAGPDRSITLPNSADLDGSASDDGLPNPPGKLATTWSKVSGPGSVSFGSANKPKTSASFSTAGTYVLRLTVSDGSLQRSDTVTVTVNPGSASGTFIDDDGSTFEADIEWLAASGITKGCNPPTNDRFCPDDYVTRGQMAAFLVRALGYTAGLGADLFVDDDGNTFENDIDRLGTAGVTRGCNPPTNDRYCPDDRVTRGQMAAFMVRAFGYTAGLGADLFVDDDGNTFENDIDRLGTAGVTRGCNPPTNDRYCPGDFVTRGQMAAFLHRALGD